MKVLHAVPYGTCVLHCTNLETGEEALVVTTPLKRRQMSVGSWRILREQAKERAALKP